MQTLSHHSSHTLATPSGPISYLLHRPAEGDQQPLLLFLHGAGERGDDLARVAQQALPRLIEAGLTVPFTVVAPQCPAQLVWSHMLDQVEALLDHVSGALGTDPARVYLTGISMGGYGAWNLAARNAGRFAALVTVCGAGETTWAPALRDLPTRVFHGQLDPVVPASASERMVQALRAVGAPVELTLYPDLAHDCWDRAYTEPALFPWLLSQRLAQSR